MIKSMTGYGRGECTMYDRKFVVELKSVNHRYNELNIRLPRVLNALEDKIRKRILSEVHRGKTEVFIQFETLSKKDLKVHFSEALCDAYVEIYKHIKSRYGLTDDLSLPVLLRIPDVITAEKDLSDDTAAKELWEAVCGALETALAAFISMRELEGGHLAEDLVGKACELQKMSLSLTERAPLVVKEHEQRLMERIQDNPLLKDVEIDQNRLITELSLFADKCCIDEELIRLRSHLSQLSAILSDRQETTGVGRKLDFLVQEINREINTIGSKSNDLTITQIIVEMKSQTEKIREQIQNLE